MDLTDFFRSSKVVVVAGKGGVGKTTVSVVLSAAAAEAGLRCLLVAIGGRAETSEGVGIDPGIGRIVRDGGHVEVMQLTPAMVIQEQVAKRRAEEIGRQIERREEFARLLRSWSPGLSSLLLLAKIRKLSERTDLDLIVVDAPATGNASLFLRAPSATLETIESGELRSQAELTQAMLTDPSRCQITLVTLAAESPVNELIETAYELEDEIGVKLGPVVVNAVEGAPEGLPDPETWQAPADLGLSSEEVASLGEAVAFTRARHLLEDRELSRLREELPLPRIELPLMPSVGLDDDALRTLVDHLRDGITALTAR